MAALAAAGIYFILEKTLTVRVSRKVLRLAEETVKRQTDLASASVLLNIANTYWASSNGQGIEERVQAMEFCLNAARSAKRTMDKIFPDEGTPSDPGELVRVVNMRNQHAFYTVELHALKRTLGDLSPVEEGKLIQQAKWAHDKAQWMKRKDTLTNKVPLPDYFVAGCEETYARCLFYCGGAKGKTEAQAIIQRLLDSQTFAHDPHVLAEFQRTYGLPESPPVAPLGVTPTVPVATKPSGAPAAAGAAPPVSVPVAPKPPLSLPPTGGTVNPSVGPTPPAAPPQAAAPDPIVPRTPTK